MTTTTAPHTKAQVQAQLQHAMAELAALPRRRQWDIEARRAVLKARVNRLLDTYLDAEQ